MIPLHINEINELIRHRRSIHPRLFTGEIIEQKIIEKLLENANWAPTHGLTEPWRFVVFYKDGIKKLAEFQAELYKKLHTQRGTFKEEKYKKLLTTPLLSSHIIAVGMKRDDREKIPEIEEVEAVACAVQNILLTATAYGIGCYWGSGGITYEEEAKPYFGLGPNDKLLGYLYLGISSEPWPEGRRKPVREKVTWVEG
jgi:nitroreductase